MKTCAALLLLPSAFAYAGLYDNGAPATVESAQVQSRIVPIGCDANQPLDSCAPTVRPFDCPSGKHWSNQGGIGLAHCVDDDPICPVDYSLTHDALGNPSCYYDPPPALSPPPVMASQVTVTAPPESAPPPQPISYIFGYGGTNQGSWSSISAADQTVIQIRYGEPFVFKMPWGQLMYPYTPAPGVGDTGDWVAGADVQALLANHGFSCTITKTGHGYGGWSWSARFILSCPTALSFPP